MFLSPCKISQPGSQYTGSFSLPAYKFAPTDQLSLQPHAWSYTEEQIQPENSDEDFDTYSGDEADFNIEVNKNLGEMGDNNPEDIDEKHMERITNPATSHDLPLLPHNFQPLIGENHTRSWHLPENFETELRVTPLCRCTDCCTHAE